MAVLIDHQAINVPQGSRSFQAANANLAGRELVIRLARCTTATPSFWPLATTTVSVSISISTDGGTTWRQAGGFSSAGGIVHGPGPAAPEATESALTCQIPADANRVKADVSVSARLITQLTVEIN